MRPPRTGATCRWRGEGPGGPIQGVRAGIGSTAGWGMCISRNEVFASCPKRHSGLDWRDLSVGEDVQTVDRPLGHAMHLVRMAGLFAVGIAVFLVARAVFVPKDFGTLGHYRPGALDDNRARKPVFAGRAACAECHADEPARLKSGPHAGVGCEACHGALGAHAAAETDVKPARPDPSKLCLVCHRQTVGKPAFFKQVDPKEHGDGSGTCGGCHDPHSPDKEPKAPAEEPKVPAEEPKKP